MARFIQPVTAPITQGFGANPAYYAQFGQKGHNGIDYGAKAGVPILASADGTIHFEGWGQNNAWLGKVAGISVLIDHGDVYSGYAHMTSTIVNKGQLVKQGQVIGYVGATGTASGPHVHFEILLKPVNINNGYYGRVDPNPYLSQSGGTLMTPNFIRRTYYMIMNQNPTQAEVDFHMSKSNPESFVNGFGDRPLWLIVSEQRDALLAERNALVTQRDGLQRQLDAEKANSASLTKQLATANARIAELDALILEKDARIKELESQGTGKPLDDYSMGDLLVAAFKKTFKIK